MAVLPVGLPLPSSKVSVTPAMRRLAGVEDAVVVGVDVDVAAELGGQQLAEVVVRRRLPAGQGDAVDQVAGVVGRCRPAVPAASRPSRYPAGCVSLTP